MSGFQNDPGTVQQEAGFGFLGRIWTESFTDNITALAGGAQAGSPVMSSMFNRITTVANNGDSVQMPPALNIPGGSIAVFNDTAKNVTVYGALSTTDTINGTANATGITIVPNSIVFLTTFPGKGGWIANGVGYGNYVNGSAPLETLSTQTGVTAAGSTQGTATQLTAAQVQVSTVALNTGVRLPPSQPGLQITIVNNGANPLTVYGSGADTIGGAASSSQAAAAVTIYYCFVQGNWVIK
jgi:hypothetical protein